MRKRVLWLLAALMIFPTMLSLAQTATPAPTTFGGTPPPTLLDALADLNTRLRTNLTLADFDNPTSRWQWQFRVFTHTALDCARPGEAFEIKETPGYEYFFLYLNRSYDYRIPEKADKSQLRYCIYPDRLPTAPTSQAVTTTVANTTNTTTGSGTTVDANGTPIANTTNGTPDAVLQALSLLNTRLGTSLTLDDLSTTANLWRWDERTFINDALECPRTGYTPITGTYPGYVIKFKYLGVTYEYRAPTDVAANVFLCSVN